MLLIQKGKQVTEKKYFFFHENIKKSMKDINSKEDISLIVNSFYSKVVKNEILKDFFKNLDFDHHMPKMIHFWSFVLLDEPGYTTNVTQKHENMPLKQEHFDEWLRLFKETIDSMYQGEKAEMAKSRAHLLGFTMASKFC